MGAVIIEIDNITPKNDEIIPRMCARHIIIGHNVTEQVLANLTFTAARCRPPPDLVLGCPRDAGKSTILAGGTGLANSYTHDFHVHHAGEGATS